MRGVSKTAAGIFFVWAVLSVRVLATQQLKADDDDITHLIPVNPTLGCWSNYSEKCHRVLQIPTDSQEAIMICQPAFMKEECIVLRKSFEAGNQAFRLTHTRAAESIWQSLPETSHDGKDHHVNVTRTEVSLSAEVAERICRIWDLMLRGVRYPEFGKELGGNDGVTYEFRRHRMFGQVWSPTNPILQDFTDLGRLLIRFCESSPADRTRFELEITGTCTKLEAKLSSIANRK